MLSARTYAPSRVSAVVKPSKLWRLAAGAAHLTFPSTLLRWRIGEHQLFKPVQVEADVAAHADDGAPDLGDDRPASPAAADGRMSYPSQVDLLSAECNSSAARMEVGPADRENALRRWSGDLIEALRKRDFPTYEFEYVMTGLQDLLAQVEASGRVRRVQRVQDRGLAAPARRRASTNEEDFVPNAKRGRKAPEHTFEYRTDEELAVALREIERREREDREEEAARAGAPR
jgi:hypothetical protein